MRNIMRVVWSLPGTHWPAVYRYAAAVVLVIFGTVLRLIIAPPVEGLPFITFYPVTTVAVALVGLGPGLMTVALGAAIAFYMFLSPIHGWQLTFDNGLVLVNFLIWGVLVCVIVNRLHQVRDELQVMSARQQVAQAAAEVAQAEAEAANEAKTRFLAAASHDLRQPVQAMRLLLQILLRRAVDPELVRIGALIGQTLESAERMLGRLMEFAALECGNISSMPQAVPLEPLLRRLVEEYHVEAGAKGLRLRLWAPDVTIETDPLLFERIMRNLISNAIRYTAHGGVLVGVRHRGTNARIEVWDTGIGIPPDKQKDVFDEFNQLGNPERDRAKGMGLGLTIVARTAALLGHRIDLVSREGRGSCFAIEVPEIAAGVTSESPQPKFLEQTWIGRRVLVVEDDEVQLLALVDVLEEAGFTVSAARDGGAALALADITPLDLIVTDYRLPGDLNGLDIIRALRQQLRYDVPAVLATGDTDDAIAAQARNEGCRVLHKPYHLETLLDAINSGISA